jgi:hypothetical protein
MASLPERSRRFRHGPVQFQYSNFIHGPEGPIDQPHSIG